jgi:hypothetical protein
MGLLPTGPNLPVNHHQNQFHGLFGPVLDGPSWRKSFIILIHSPPLCHEVYVTRFETSFHESYSFNQSAAPQQYSP